MPPGSPWLIRPIRTSGAGRPPPELPSVFASRIPLCPRPCCSATRKLRRRIRLPMQPRHRRLRLLIGPFHPHRQSSMRPSHCRHQLFVGTHYRCLQLFMQPSHRRHTSISILHPRRNRPCTCRLPLCLRSHHRRRVRYRQAVHHRLCKSRRLCKSGRLWIHHRSWWSGHFFEPSASCASSVDKGSSTPAPSLSE